MGKKQKRPAEQRPITKRQLSRWQRQRRINRLTVLVGSVVIAIVLAILGWGYHQKVYIPHQQDVAKLRQIVAVVDDRSFDLEYFIDALHFLGLQSPGWSLSSLATEVVPLIRESQLIREEAERRGLSVAKAEIDEILEDTPLKKNRVARELTEAGLLQPKLSLAIVDEKLPATAPQIEVQAMLLGEGDYETARHRVEAGDDFAVVAQELSVDGLPSSQRGQPLWLPLPPWGIAEPALNEALPELQVGQLSLPIWDEEATRTGGYWVIQALPESTEAETSDTGADTEEAEARTVEVRAILTSTAEKAQELRRSVESGEDMEALAEEHSQHFTAYDGGYMKVTEGAGTVSPAFEEAALALEPGELSEPVYDQTVYTQGGYWLLEVLSREERPLDTVEVPVDWFIYLDAMFAPLAGEFEVYQLWELRLFSEWLTEAREGSTLENHWDDLDQEVKDWAIERATPKT